MGKRMRSSFSKLLAQGMAALAMSTALWCDGAEFQPTKPLRFIMPLAAGSSADVAARALARELVKTWKQPVIVDNRPGAGTVIGTNHLAASPPDGYTFGWVIAAHAINPSLYPKLPYDTGRDFAGVTLVYRVRIVIVASNSFPARTVSDLIAWAKARPGELVYASPATGSGPHLLGELFKLKFGIEMSHIGYKGGATAHPDVISGRVPVLFDTLPGALPLVRSGKLRPIAVISDAPVTAYPEFPALKGLLPVDATTGWNGIVVPARTPAAIIKRLNADIVAAVRSPEVQERLDSLTVETVTTTPQQFDAFIREEIVRWSEVVRRAAIKIDAP
jgi:tripartite-type tricarboxylate transporter receptor subunit TctC